MIATSLEFRYNGIDSSDMKLLNVTLSSGLAEEPFMANRELHKIIIKGRDNPYFQKVKPSPLTFSLNFAFSEPWNDSLINEIKSWLAQDYYKPMVFSEDIEIVNDMEVIKKMYYCIMVSDSTILHNGLKEGYCKLKFECSSPYAYSPKHQDVIDCSQNTNSGTSFTFNNLGNKVCYPKVTINKIGDGDNEQDISIINLSDKNKETRFIVARRASGLLTFNDGVVDGETVTIGNDTYEFDVDNLLTTGNIKVDISGLTKTNASIELGVVDTVKDGDTITIGDLTFEFDSNTNTDGEYTEDIIDGNIPINITPYTVPSINILIFNDVPIDGELIAIGNDIYEFDTNNSILSGNIRVNIKGLTTVESVGNKLSEMINLHSTNGVLSEASEGELSVKYKIMGTIGNSIPVYKTCENAIWKFDTFVGGEDCSIDDALVVITNIINNTDDFIAEFNMLIGDINKDGEITVSDLTLLERHLSGTEILTGNALLAADVNQDGVVNSSDTQRLLEHLNGTNPLPNEFIGNKIIVKAKSSGNYFGSLGNGIKCSAVSNGLLFKSTVLSGGLDCTGSEGAYVLKQSINSNTTENIVAENPIDNVIKVTYNTSGKHGEIPVDKDAVNVSWNSKNLIGGDGILDDEVVILDNERRNISTNLFGISRYDVFNNNYLSLNEGVNDLLIKGNGIFTFEYEFRYL